MEKGGGGRSSERGGGRVWGAPSRKNPLFSFLFFFSFFPKKTIRFAALSPTHLPTYSTPSIHPSIPSSQLRNLPAYPPTRLALPIHPSSMSEAARARGLRNDESARVYSFGKKNGCQCEFDRFVFGMYVISGFLHKGGIAACSCDRGRIR